MEAAAIPQRGPSPMRSAAGFVSENVLWIAMAAVLVYLFAQHPEQTFGDVKDGLSNGVIWALIALGYTLVYGIIELINFAHGDVFMIGSFTSVSLWGVFGLGLTTGALGL